MANFDFAPPTVGIDWHAEMRDQLGALSQMNDALSSNAQVDDPRAEDNFGQVVDMFARMVNVCTFLLDENRDLRNRLSTVCDVMDRTKEVSR